MTHASPTPSESSPPEGGGRHLADDASSGIDTALAERAETSGATGPADAWAPEAEPMEGEKAAAAAKRAKAETIGRYVAMFVMPVLMVGMMIWGYLFSMHNPTPHNMPVVVAGAGASSLSQAIESSEPDAVEATTAENAEEARWQVTDREVAAAVVVEGETATLYTATSAGASQATTITQLVTPSLIEAGLSIKSEDLAPLPDSDPAGLGAMFMATALVMAGYLPLSITLSNAPTLMRFRRFVPLLAGWAALVAGLTWLVTGPILGVVSSDDGWAVFGIAALGVFAIGAVQLFLTRIMGPMAVLAAMFLLMVLGMPASNLSISIYTAPPFYVFLHSFLPTPAIGEAMRSVLYFGGNGAWPHLLVLIIGAVAGLALTLLIDALKRRKNPTPGLVMVNMPSLHGGPRPKTRFWRYASLIFFPFAMVALMLSCMLGAMQSPTPRDMPVAVVGASTQQAQQAVDGMNERLGDMFDLRVVESSNEAREQVEDREIVGAFVLPSRENPQATVITNQSAGSSAEQTVTRVFTQVAQAQQLEVVNDDVAPLPERDSMGSVTLYVAMGWIMAGFMIIVVGANAAPASRPLRKLLPIVAVYSVAMSALIWLIAVPFTGSVDGHFWQLLGTGVVVTFCVAMFATVLERLMGLLAIIPVVGVLMFLGVPSSNGALSIYMEPELFRGLHEWLPMPAAVEAAHSILYFGSDTLGTSLLCVMAWGAASLVLVAIIDKFKPVRTTSPVIMVPAHGSETVHFRELAEKAEREAAEAAAAEVPDGAASRPEGGSGSGDKELVNA
ncbi:ABC transporter permease [Galactobacter valiniphilus]|nr:ABC transporter permease [Galactobacter valiniphilus]